MKLCKITSREFAEAYGVRTHSFHCSISEMCKSRNGQWAMTVLGRKNSKTSELYAEDAVYYQTCSVNFRTGKDIPKKFRGQEEVSDVPPPKKRKGRPCDSERKAALEEALRCYANSEELVPLSIILRKMAHILSETYCDSLAYSFRQAKIC